MRSYTTGLKSQEQSEWKAIDTVLGQLSVNCPFCAKVLCGLCFTASCGSHATKAKLQANIQMRPEAEILFFSIRGWSLLTWLNSTGSRKRPAMQSAASWMTRESGDVCVFPVHASHCLLNMAIKENKCTWPQANCVHTYMQYLSSFTYYLFT